MTPARATLWLIGVSTLLRIGWAASLGPGNDEAYYLQYTRHPDFSYFDHPPMVAWLAWLGLRLGSALPMILAMRLPFIVLFSGSTWLVYRLAERHFSARAGLFAALVLSAAGYFPLAAGSFALPDGPLVFWWLVTLHTLRSATRKPAGMQAWIGVGLAWGCALLSKYHAALLPLGYLTFLIIEPRGRAWLRQPGPYLALAVGLLVFSPVLGWNAAHGWSSFAFQGGRALGAEWSPRPDRLVGVIGGQLLYLLPWVWLVLVIVLVKVVRAQTTSAGERFLAAQAMVPLAAFLTVGLWKSLLPHWSLIGFLPLIPLLGNRLDQQARRRPLQTRLRLGFWLAAPMAVAAAMLLQTNYGILQRDGWAWFRVLPPAQDPSLDLYGWRELVSELKVRRLVETGETPLMTSKWYHTSQLAFGLPQHMPVLCTSNRAPLGFRDWSLPEQWVGRDSILAVINHSSTEPAAYERWFERIEPLGGVTIKRNGAAVKVVQLYRCVRQKRPLPNEPVAIDAPRMARLASGNKPEPRLK